MRLIDTDAAKEKACEKWTYVGTEVVCDFLDAQATVDAAPVVHAHISGTGYTLHCSNCKENADIGNDYCPHCGAKMDTEEERP